MGGLSGILFGSNPGLKQAQGNLNSLAGYSSNVGQQGTNAAMNFDTGLLSGNPQLTAQVMAPAIQTAQNQAQQNKNTVAQFGNRGGGMNSVMAGLDDQTRAKLLGLQGSLMQGAAGQLGQLGTQNLQLGQQGNMDAAQIAQMQQNNLMNSVLGKGIGDFAGTALNAGEAGLGF